jgi:peroxiredoxin
VKNQKQSRNRLSRYLWISLVVVASIATYLLLHPGTAVATSAPQPSLPVDAASAAPAFTLTDLNGKSVSLSDFKGKVVILDFWATWCPPCKREIPDFINLQKEYGARGLQVVGIALDEPGKVQAFASQNGINYPVLLGTDDIAWKYGGIQGIPTTFVIDKTGKITAKFEGYRPRDVFESEIKKRL